MVTRDDLLIVRCKGKSRMHRRLFLAGLALPSIAHARVNPVENELLLLYMRFVGAQNRHDAAAVRELLLDSPGFLWISDGKPFWGPDAMIERMSAFQKSEVWEVTPDLHRTKFVDVSPESAFLFQPLTLKLGRKSDPRTIAFLVNVLCVKKGQEWRIAALFTTEENPN
jgi:hypothetical protein